MRIAFTVCSANYLPYAKALADSLLQHNPGYQFVMALADTFRGYDAAFSAPHRIVPVTEMNLPYLDEMNGRYNVFELSCALKPFVSEYLLHTHPDCETIFYFDSDILLFGPLTLAETVLQTHSLVLTPHLSVALQYQTGIATELDVLHTGLYNAGFFGLQRGAEGFAFLRWWQQRLRLHCFNDAAHGLFVDQLWLSLVPVLFRECFVLYDPGYNLAYWNFPERSLTEVNGRLTVNEKHPLIFYHYSGYDIAQSEKVSKHDREGHRLENLPQYAPLFHAYRAAVNANNAVGFFSLPLTMGKQKGTQVREKNFFKRKFRKLFKKS